MALVQGGVRLGEFIRRNMVFFGVYNPGTSQTCLQHPDANANDYADQDGRDLGYVLSVQFNLSRS